MGKSIPLQKKLWNMLRKRGLRDDCHQPSFSICTKIAKALKIPTSTLVTHSGAFIADKLDEPLHVKKLTEEKTFNLVQILESFDCNVRLLHEKFSIGNRKKHSLN